MDLGSFFALKVFRKQNPQINTMYLKVTRFQIRLKFYLVKAILACLKKYNLNNRQ